MERRHSKRNRQSEPYQRRPASSYVSRAYENRERSNVVFSPEKMREKIRSYGLNILDEKNSIFDWEDEKDKRRTYSEMKFENQREERYVRGSYDYAYRDVQRESHVPVRERRSSFNMAESLRGRGTVLNSNPLIEKYKYLIDSPLDSRRIYESPRSYDDTNYSTYENNDKYQENLIDSSSSMDNEVDEDDLSAFDIEIKGKKIPKTYFKAFPSMNKTSNKRVNKTIGISKDKCLDERENSAFKFIRPRTFPPVPDFSQSTLKRPRTDDITSEINTIKKRRLLTNNVPESEKKRRMLHQKNPLSPALTYDQVLSRKKKIQNRLQNNFKPSLRVKLYNSGNYENLPQGQFENMEVDREQPSSNPPLQQTLINPPLQQTFFNPLQQKPAIEKKPVKQESVAVVELLDSSDDEDVSPSPVQETSKISYSSFKKSSDSEREYSSDRQSPESESSSEKVYSDREYSSESQSTGSESVSKRERTERSFEENQNSQRKSYSAESISEKSQSQSSQDSSDRVPHSPQSACSQDSSDIDLHNPQSDSQDSSDRVPHSPQSDHSHASSDRDSHSTQSDSSHDSSDRVPHSPQSDHTSHDSSDRAPQEQDEKTDDSSENDAMIIEDGSSEKLVQSKFFGLYQSAESSSSSDRNVQTIPVNNQPFSRTLSFGEKDDEVSASSSNIGFGNNKADDEDIPDAFTLTKTESDASLFLGSAGKLTYEKNESSGASFSLPQSTYSRTNALNRALSFRERDDEISESSSNIVENRYGDEDLPDAFSVNKTESDASLILKIPSGHSKTIENEVLSHIPETTPKFEQKTSLTGSFEFVSQQYEFGSVKNPVTPPISPSQSSPGFGRRTSFTIPTPTTSSSLSTTNKPTTEKSDGSEN